MMPEDKKKKWKSPRDCWGVWLKDQHRFLSDEYDTPIAFESVEEAIDYVKESKIINNKEELATTPQEAEEREGIRAIISPIRIMSRSL
jgi:hypothetical protein